MRITGAKVFTGDGFASRDIYIEGERFAESGGGERIDASGCYAIPGLIDLHTHGCARHDYSMAGQQGLAEMAAYEASQGVTALLPTIMTLPEEVMAKACREIAAYDGGGADFLGVNLEGPFLSPQNAGAQNPDNMRAPDIGIFTRLQEAAGGRVKVVSIAPEMPGAMDIYAALRDKVVCSVAHTKADYDTAKKAFEAGASLLTHTFNAMPPLLHRAPGVIGAAFEAQGVDAEIICDGLHIHPSAVRAAFRLFGEDRMVFVSDSMMATGLEDGEYVLGDMPVTVRGNKATLTGTDTIAGSVTNLMRCVRIAATEMGVPLHVAVACATTHPARKIGVFADYGSIDAGKVASLVLLREGDLAIERVILRGTPL